MLRTIKRYAQHVWEFQPQSYCFASFSSDSLFHYGIACVETYVSACALQEKIKKLVDIWERGSTFPAPLLISFKEKLNAASSEATTLPSLCNV